MDVELSRRVVIARPIEKVFAYVADACNDPGWCPKVVSVKHVAGNASGPGARFEVVHRPIPLRPPRKMDHTCLSWEPPSRIDWREDDGTDLFMVTYKLEDLGGSTRITQDTDAQLKVPRLLYPVMRAGMGRDIDRQLKTLKTTLEM